MDPKAEGNGENITETAAGNVETSDFVNLKRQKREGVNSTGMSEIDMTGSQETPEHNMHGSPTHTDDLGPRLDADMLDSQSSHVSSSAQGNRSEVENELSNLFAKMALPEAMIGVPTSIFLCGKPDKTSSQVLLKVTSIICPPRRNSMRAAGSIGMESATTIPRPSHSRGSISRSNWLHNCITWSQENRVNSVFSTSWKSGIALTQRWASLAPTSSIKQTRILSSTEIIN